MDTRSLTMQSSYTEIFQRLSKLTTPAICDASPDVRIMDKKIKSKSNIKQCIGRTYTVNSNQDSLSTMQALDDVQAFLAFLDCKDDVVPIIMMIASCGAKVALAGEVCVRVAKARGFGGVIIDGPYRDIDEIEACNLPFFAKGTYPQSGTKDKVGNTKRKINCGGVEINPGEIVFGDRNGILVMSKEEAVNAIPKAEAMKQGENHLLYRIEEEGAQFKETCNIDKHVDNINEGIPSKLKMT